MKKVQQDITNAEAKFVEARTIIQQQSAVGKERITERMRKQVANYLGMDERFFVAEGEAVMDAITGKQKTYVDKNGVTQLSTGVGGRTMGADELNALMGQGTDIIEGVHAKAGKMMITNIAVESLLGIKDTNPNDAIAFLDSMRTAGNIHQAEGESTANVAVIELREQVNKRLTLLQSQVDAGDESKRQQLEFLQSMAAEGEDSQVLRAYAGSLSDFMNNQESYSKYSAMMKENATDSAKREAGQRAFLYRWVGSELFNKTQESDTMAKFMGQAVGMDMTEPVFDIVLKTLGKAGGEILGKTYNIFIGTTFQDAPIISTGRAMMDENSELYSAVKRHYYQDGAEINMSKLSETQRQRVKEHMNNHGFNSEAEAARDMFDNEFQTYVDTTSNAVAKAEATQGFMKNIHQLLRDSIKLKSGSGEELMDKLKGSSKEYHELSTDIARMESGDIDNMNVDEKEKYKALILQRDNVVNNMSSELGPGPGLKSLMDMDYLINESSSKALSLSNYESRFLGGDKLQNNIEFVQLNKRLANVRDDYNSIDSRDSVINTESKDLMTMARYQTARNVASMITSYHMNNNLDQGILLNRSFAADHKRKLATELGYLL